MITEDVMLKVLQIGAGSMGTRRMRDLVARDDIEVALLDFRGDRSASAEKRFGIATFADKSEVFAWKPEALIISTPPDKHDEYIKIALDSGLHHFCEENIWTYDHIEVERLSKEKSLVSAPSCSFHFLPIVKKLRKLLESGEMGSLHSYQMTLSTYMPDWHPKEGNDFYARKRSTAAGREMVPFELVWLNYVFGAPKRVNGMIDRFGNLDNAYEDSWSLQMVLEPSGVGALTVLHSAVPIVRRGTCVCENAVVDFDIVSGELRIVIGDSADVEKIECGAQSEVLERAYFDEINTFVDTVLGEAEWPHSYLHSAVATATLAAAEASSSDSASFAVDANVQPTRTVADDVFV